MSASFEFAMVDLGNQDGCGRLPDRTQHRQQVNLLPVWKCAVLICECRFTVRFNLVDLIANELVVPKHAFDIAAKKRRKITSVPRFDMVEALLQTLPDPLAAQLDVVAPWIGRFAGQWYSTVTFWPST